VQFARNRVDFAAGEGYGSSRLAHHMSDPGPAQLELIRRYSRTLREMHADAMAARGNRAADRAGRIVRARPASEPIRQAAKAMTSRSAQPS
jgi:hypothetical protein